MAEQGPALHCQDAPGFTDQDMNTRTKIMTSDELVKHLNYTRSHFGSRIGLCTGVFDVLHIGHKRLLEEAASACDELVVGINSDSAVSTLKGPTRPVNSEMDRAEMLASIHAVGTVFIIDATNVAEAIRMVRPIKWFKGGDYTLQTLDPHELAIAKEVGAEIVIVPSTNGYSTTSILNRC